MIRLYQAEWCPFSSAVRQRLTELGVDFVARQVAPEPEQRDDVDEIPTLETEDGTRYVGTRAAFAYLARLDSGRYEREHRQKLADHPDRHRTTTTVLEKAAPLE